MQVSYGRCRAYADACRVEGGKCRDRGTVRKGEGDTRSDLNRSRIWISKRKNGMQRKSRMTKDARSCSTTFERFSFTERKR